MEKAQYACMAIGIVVAVYGLISIVRKSPPMVNAKDINPEKLSYYSTAIGSGCLILGAYWTAWSIFLFSPTVLLVGSIVVIAGILMVETRARK